MAGYSKCDRCRRPLGEVCYRIGGDYDRIKIRRNIRSNEGFSMDICENCFRELERFYKKGDETRA